MKTAKAEQQAFIRDWTKMRRERLPRVPRLPNERDSRAAQTRARRAGEFIFPATYPKGTVSQQELRLLMPPGGFIWQDVQHGGWSTHVPPFHRCSRRWALHGGCEAAAVKVMRDAWFKYSLLCAVTVAEACPFSNLFDADLCD